MDYTLEEAQALLAITKTQIEYVLNNSHLTEIEIQTPEGKTRVRHGDFGQALKTLMTLRNSLIDRIKELSSETSSVVDFSAAVLSVPIVFQSGR